MTTQPSDAPNVVGCKSHSDFDEVSSAAASVADSLDRMTTLCGFDVTVDFMNEMDLILKSHLHGYQMAVRRDEELRRLQAAGGRVQSIARQFVHLAPPRPNGARAPQAAPDAQQAAAATATTSRATAPPSYSDLRDLRRRGIVSNLPSAFLARLASIVQAPQPRASPSSASVVGGASFRRASVASGGAISPELETPIRHADESYYDQLIPPPSVFLSPEEELGSIVELRTASRLLVSQFRNRLENLIQHRMTRQNIQPTRLARVRGRRGPPPPAQQQQQPQHQQTHTASEPMTMAATLDHTTTFTSTAQQAQGGMGAFRSIRVLGAGNSQASTLWSIQREMDEMKQQITSLQRMLESSLAMQAEMARTLGQEVSAVLHAARSSSKIITPPTATQQSHNNGCSPAAGTLGKCVVCAENDADVVFFRCGHQCTCLVCAHQCKAANQSCPICRAPIQDFVKSYQV
eukprot:c20534_g1_i2.p1 GENE.c20534_g1_i2~~c20534_g1_i2.p1  ORF type:complete len:462 (+),score=87.20 c20534_g1_i2:140-1525(+)